MTKVNTNLLFACYLFILLMCASCRKHKETIYHIRGRLLFSNTNPIPVPGYTLEFHQLASIGGPFPIYASSSSSTSTTDAQGIFRCDFTPGETKLMGRRQGPNPYPVNLQITNNNRQAIFEFRNFPPGNMGDVYLFKKIDTVVLVIDAKFDIKPTDSLDIIYSTVNGTQYKRKKGISVAGGSSNVIIDTVYDVVSTYFDYQSGKYNAGFAIIQMTTTQPWQIPYSSLSTVLDAGDEKKRVLNLR